ncbi:unnamed protein product [Rotaria sp. Silwood2]|nr:unnamed protein product [Rotaria sp. Silwood2]CAF2921514.1 unnamed protein product [Rotaria sp. Silwood2]CAF3387974.1 unnamed protein product [Rotaria sp. Silwood2]CAF4212201.1 unnamed protein product [Rotaria sp. Silwood2]CAF4270704.1 unnamed protein product [Rotaria sp. Silwood2]
MSADNIQDTSHRFSDVAEEPCIMLAPIEGFNKKPLVTLEKATEPLHNIVPRLHTFVHIAKQRAKHPADDLSVDESASIALYTMEWEPYTESLYYILNKTLRNEDRKNLKPWFLYLKLIITALSRLPLINVTVYRGVKDIIESEHEKYKVGKRLVWWGFSSCSTNRDVSEDDQFVGKTGIKTLFIIDCVKGIDVGNHSYFRKENEILLLPATQVEVIGYEEQEDNLRIIYLEEIESSHILLEPISSEEEIQDLRKISGSQSKIRIPIIFPTMVARYRNNKLNESIQRCKSDAEAYLNGRRLSKADLEIVVKQVMIDKQCRAVFLRESHIIADGAYIISEALRDNNTLEKLFLSHNKIGDDGAKYLARALSGDNNSTLKQITLCHNDITDQGIEYLAKMLESNKTLTHLWLASNKITDQGLHMLCHVLMEKNKTLQVLHLEWNKFRNDTSVTILLDMLNKNKSLTKINLENCKLSKSGIEQLKHLVKTKKNFELLIN